MRGRAAAAAALAWLAVAVAAAPGGPAPYVERPPEDELVLQLLLRGIGTRRLVLRDALLGYRAGEQVLLPLGEITSALDLAIRVDPEAGRAEGFFLSEERRFALDLAPGEVRVEGRRETVAPGGVERHLGDLYVESSLLGRWFPLEVRLELARMIVEIEPREALPIQQRYARQQQRDQRSFTNPSAPSYPRLEVPYRLAELGFLDVGQSLEYESELGASARYSALLTGDLLRMDTRVHLLGENDEPLRDVRLTLGRKDPDRRLLGPLRASELELGDVFTPALPLISEQREGRGAMISSFPLDRPTDFDRTTLRGDLQPGWEVELYRNGMLLDSRPAGIDGRYEFLEVPLLFGSNLLELEFYGPQGQRRSETRRLWVGSSMVPPGEQRYRLAFGQHARDLIPVGRDTTPYPERRGGARVFLEYERGLERRLSLAARAGSLPLDDGQHGYASLGLLGSLLGAFGRLDVAADSRGGQALLASVQTERSGIGFTATHEEFLDFVSERAEADDALRSRTESRIDGLLRGGPLPQLPFSVSGTVERGETGRIDAELSQRLSLSLGALRASHVLGLRRLAGGGLEPYQPVEGALLLHARLGDTLLRQELGYELTPTTELSSLGLTWGRRLWQRIGAQLGVRRELRGSPTTIFSPRLFGRIQNFAVGLDGSMSDDGDFAVALALSFGAARDPRTGALRIRPIGVASDGAASARVFLDLNQNGRFEPGEQPLEGVRFERQGELATDAEGFAFLTGLSSYRRTPLRVERESLVDPFWVPSSEGVEIVARPGKTALIEIPVTPTGEIEGTVYLESGPAVAPGANVGIQLLDAEGAVAREVRTEFDGFYLFDFVPPGEYRVAVEPEQIRRASLQEPLSREVVVVGNGAVVAGVDFVIDRSPSPTLLAEAPEIAELGERRGPKEPELDRGGSVEKERTEHSDRPGRAEPRQPESAGPHPPKRVDPAPPATAGEAAAYRVQLASYRGPTRAREGWARLRADHRELLVALAEQVERVSLAQGVVYRLQVGPLESERTAQELCRRLQARGVACLVVQPDGSLPEGMP